MTNIMIDDIDELVYEDDEYSMGLIQLKPHTKTG